MLKMGSEIILSLTFALLYRRFCLFHQHQPQGCCFFKRQNRLKNKLQMLMNKKFK